MSKTPALSIQQPWAWLIVHGYKRIENRSWRCTSHRPILIHAGLKLDQDAHDALIHGVHPVTGDVIPVVMRSHYWSDFHAGCVYRGGVIGTAEIRGCVTESDDPFFVGPFGIIVASARTLRFQPCRGALGFFKPKIDVDMAVVPKVL